MLPKVHLCTLMSTYCPQDSTCQSPRRLQVWGLHWVLGRKQESRCHHTVWAPEVNFCPQSTARSFLVHPSSPGVPFSSSPHCRSMGPTESLHDGRMLLQVLRPQGFEAPGSM